MAGATLAVFSTSSGLDISVTLASNSLNSAAQSVTVVNPTPWTYHLTGTWNGAPLASVLPSAGTNAATGQPWPAGDVPPSFPQTTFPLTGAVDQNSLANIGCWTNFTANP